MVLSCHHCAKKRLGDFQQCSNRQWHTHTNTLACVKNTHFPRPWPISIAMHCIHKVCKWHQLFYCSKFHNINIMLQIYMKTMLQRLNIVLFSQLLIT